MTEIEAVHLVNTTETDSVTSSSNYTEGHALEKRKVDTNKPEYCSVNYKDRRNYVQNDPNLTMIYFVTPTYPRPVQIAELTRLSHTLMLVPRLHWILVDDNVGCSVHVLRILKRSGLPFTHVLSTQQSDNNRDQLFHSDYINEKVSDPSAGLNWIHNHVKEGILYFGDDDNTYDLDLFNEIRKTKKLSMFPVGLAGEFGVSSPMVENGSVVGFFAVWRQERKFPVDMAGFAVNIEHLQPTADMLTEVNFRVPIEEGMLVDRFLTSAGFEISDIEPLADNCTKVLVWLTRTQRYDKIRLQADLNMIKSSQFKSLGKLLNSLSELNVMDLFAMEDIYGEQTHDSAPLDLSTDNEFDDIFRIQT
ncbi:glycosyltransferase family 43 domain-containing protein [Phthorimaea operculella]|nr:glycosyltransferase family 43 domain-containing protein [Phthorimaea operculella]